MNGYDILDVIGKIPMLEYYFKGCYTNSNVPKKFLYLNDGFIIVNTLTQNSESVLGHWVMYAKKNNELFFFDSFGISPISYGGDISRLYRTFNQHKMIVFNYPIQDKSSFICGLYSIFFSFFLYVKNYSVALIRSQKIFSKTYTKRNDFFVKKYIHKLTGFQLLCNEILCPLMIYDTV